MDKIVVRGGAPLHGRVRVSGSKNAALPILVSSLLVKGKTTFCNVPELMDIHSITCLLAELGATVERTEDKVTIDAGPMNCVEAPYDLVRKMRASILVLGPLVARMGRAKVSMPGGCAIGDRPIDLHLKGLEAMGATIRLEQGYVEATADRLKGARIVFDTVSVGATENLMMAATLADGVTILSNAAREPEIMALADVLNAMGAKVEGAGTPEITITGVTALSSVDAAIIPDRIEAGTFMVAAAMTGGDVEVTACAPEHMEHTLSKLEEAGATLEVGKDSVRVIGPKAIKSVDIRTAPYPGFPTDMQAQFMAMLTLADGASVIHETIFENRFIHVSELKRMGADIVLKGNDVATVKGIKRLSGAQVMASDLRASASLILSGLVAEGETVVNRVYHLDRGYEHIETKLRGLGADIERIKG
ncbi:UDP-N-acetylglucosamine 1-carboxyvinyltransferase [Desulfoluna butyratoxydans]|uniref:UDP-N-acetylglucosamine 1-carboxyvinyltransferase n=1 Tax=Desulfoluna butyratoxydans TaxID=231438 RepID=A0A4U8YVX0_9BACT|nr:UDP-N-acetylglucosamine 1-carboxyvinyltransferase [Desulfoluna butyratoxydans]VFQ45553.1 udp-n-acetylglucosamine 1-carboxyvinyltransferase [Desulfoluna butyratoxydans]